MRIIALAMGFALTVSSMALAEDDGAKDPAKGKCGKELNTCLRDGKGKAAATVLEACNDKFVACFAQEHPDADADLCAKREQWRDKNAVAFCEVRGKDKKKENHCKKGVVKSLKKLACAESTKASESTPTTSK